MNFSFPVKPIFLFIMAFAVSCEDEPSVAMMNQSLFFDLGETPLDLGTSISTPQGFVRLSDVKFYLSDVYMHYSNGDSALWYEVMLVDFEENPTLQNEFLTIPSENFARVSFGLGVKPEWNEGVDPSEFAPEQPLSFQSSNGMHWGWETGYKFLVFDAIADTGSGQTDWPVSYHVGTSALYKRHTIDLRNTSGGVHLYADPAAIFDNLDFKISENPQTHTLNNEVVAEKFRDAFLKSIRQR